MRKWIKAWIRKHFDYDIIGEYYDRADNGHLVKKYLKKYRIRRKRR